MGKENTVKIFGTTYPLYKNQDGSIDENSVRWADYLPGFFASHKHFSPQEYYRALIAKFPQFKRKWYDVSKLPSEKDIEKYFIANLGYAAMDGANSVPPVERKYGIKIGGGYKYPGGMTDIEYHAYRFNKLGFSRFDDKKVETMQDAYMYIWQWLHYSRDAVVPTLQSMVQELIDLNPSLKNLRFDKNDSWQLTYILAGATYNFPPQDIQLFLDGVRGHDMHDKQNAQLAALGLEPKDFHWVLSPETIRNIAVQLKDRDMSRPHASTSADNNAPVNKVEEYEKATGRVKSNAAKKIMACRSLEISF